MVIKKLSKQQQVKQVKCVDRNIENLTEDFISSGGMTTSESSRSERHNSRSIRDEEEVRFTLRIPKHMLQEIDEQRKHQDGSISRNTWILQLISSAL